MYVICKGTSIEQKTILIISKSVQEIFFKYRQIRNNDIEACGILIGNHKIDGNIVIKAATSPQSKDKRSRYSFKINVAAHQDILEKCFKVSRNEDVYLGTWHTHPENIPTPSMIDIQDWKKQQQANKKLFIRMAFIIVGIKKIGCWIIESVTLFGLTKANIIYD
jgi:integrative and conjugative element protein (TIGR02256 family)